MTPRELISAALLQAGIIGQGQTASAEDINNGLKSLNMMVGQWARKRFVSYHLVQYSVACDGGVSYTIGPGGDINVATRPDKIDYAFIRQTNLSAPNQVDWPLTIIPARETYDNIALKQLASFPQYLYYDAASPQGLLYPWPLPSNQYSLHATVKMLWSQFTNLDTDMGFPYEYEEAMLYNLMVRLGIAYTMPVREEVMGMAKASMQTLRGANAQIPLANLPRGLMRPGLYNIYSDQSY